MSMNIKPSPYFAGSVIIKTSALETHQRQAVVEKVIRNELTPRILHNLKTSGSGAISIEEIRQKDGALGVQAKDLFISTKDNLAEVTALQIRNKFNKASLVAQSKDFYPSVTEFQTALKKQGPQPFVISA